MKFFIIFFLVVTLAAALEDTFYSEDRIANGNLAAPGQFPYQVGLNFTKGKDGWICGGSLISSTWVLTAAHCVLSARSVKVLLGGIDWLEPDLSFTVDSSNFIPHENFNYLKCFNDIALIKIPRVSFTKLIQKIDLPKETPSETQYINEFVFVSGWGKTKDILNHGSRILQYATMTIISNEECQKTYVDTQFGIMPKKICAKSRNDTSACQGDSGGPMILSDSKILIGIASYILRGECEKGYPPVYTRVTSYLDWIADKTGIQY